MINYIIYRSDGTNYDMDSYTITKNIEDGYGHRVNGEYVLHRINNVILSGAPPDMDQLMRFAACGGTKGFAKFCDVHQWGLARSLVDLEVTAGCLTQDDADLVDGLLPT